MNRAPALPNSDPSGPQILGGAVGVKLGVDQSHAHDIPHRGSSLFASEREWSEPHVDGLNFGAFEAPARILDPASDDG